MKNILENKERYISDNIPIRLGGIAANLARVYSISKNPLNFRAVETMIDESKYFIDWTVKDVELDTQLYLLELQRQLSAWHLHLTEIWNDENKKRDMAAKAKMYSDKLLEMSGLLQSNLFERKTQ